MTVRYLAAALIAPLALGACSFSYDSDSGATETKTYPLSDFDSVEVEAGVEVILKQGAFAIEAMSHRGDLSKLSMDVSGTKLRIGRRGGWDMGMMARYTVTVTAPSYVGVDASSGSSVDGGDLKLGEIQVDASSGGNIELSGVCTTMKAEVASGGRIDAEDLKCERVEAKASSGGRADLWASASAKGEASSGGNIDIGGSPPERSKDVSSGGSVDIN